ncbi:MAG: ATP-dependent Clp protease adaptor ClpS, partial [Chloroflexi bacterium]|nr:ATP-dependent Clp protease adaptor ClpS [Chloroflexota bacterium]
MNATTPGTEVRPSINRETVVRHLPPYSVMLHNDDYNDMLHVVRSIVICVPEIEPDQAVGIMMEAHENGQAHVITCPLERAELYRDR